uniref:Peptidase M20 n=1 Tax=Streptomyces antibioticus TaxID=1890 RepID=Q0R4L4_STRAT|nr:peptidase M20 [Streptomyces antibioticus]
MLQDWLAARVLPHRRLHDATGALVGLLIPGGRPGSWWTLDACVETAPYGDETAWSFPPASGDIVDGWLRGRGSSDSKLAAAMFCHIAADLAPAHTNARAGSPCSWTSMSTPAASAALAPTSPTRPRLARPG